MYFSVHEENSIEPAKKQWKGKNGTSSKLISSIVLLSELLCLLFNNNYSTPKGEVKGEVLIGGRALSLPPVGNKGSHYTFYTQCIIGINV